MAHHLSHKKIIAVFVPAILLGSLALFIQIIRYEPLYPDIELTEEEKIGISSTILPIDPIFGERQSPITLIEFGDFACLECKTQHEMLTELQRQYPKKFKVVWKGIPFQLPKPTIRSHEYAYCAREQDKFAEFASYAFANHTDLSETTLSLIANEIKLDPRKLESCLTSGKALSYITQTTDIAQYFNIQVAPTFFLNNAQITTPRSLEEWKLILKL